MTNLGYALLGLLAREAQSGYDLAQSMKMPVGFFWQANHSQIYPELARLQAEELVTHQVVEQHDRPNKKIYTITEAGLEILKKWLISPVDGVPVRDELVLKAYYLWLVDPARSVALFEQQAHRHRQQLAQYEKILREGKAATEGKPPTLNHPFFGGYLTLMRGIGYEREYAGWCEWVVEQLKLAMPDRPAE